MTAKLKVDGTSKCDLCQIEVHGKIHQPEQENYDASIYRRQKKKTKRKAIINLVNTKSHIANH